MNQIPIPKIDNKHHILRIASLVKEHKEAKKKINEVDDAKKTFLKIQIPKMEQEIKTLKVTVAELLEAEELDPRGEYFLLAKKLSA